MPPPAQERNTHEPASEHCGIAGSAVGTGSDNIYCLTHFGHRASGATCVHASNRGADIVPVLLIAYEANHTRSHFIKGTRPIPQREGRIGPAASGARDRHPCRKCPYRRGYGHCPPL